MAIGQKQSVVNKVLELLPGFTLYKNIALVMLSANQLEALKSDIAIGIHQGLIEYSKDKDNHAEVVPYARSMVMNHLKKARELNGNAIYGNGTAVVAKEPKGFVIDKDLLTQDLKDYVETL